MENKMLNSYTNPKINSLIFKLTDFCNLGCSYCYRGSNEEKPRDVMSDELIALVIEKYILFKKGTGREQEPMVLVWHGGEPLTAGIDKFKKIMEIEEDLRKKYNVKFINSVQTNGTLINKEYTSFFKENNFVVGFSLDGPKFIQDLSRYNKNGNSSFDATMRGIRLTKEAGIYVNAISVISNESASHVDEIYTFMRDSGINTVDFIPSFYYETDVTLIPEKYTEFMLRILELWKQDKFTPLKVRFLNDVYRRVIHRFDNKPLLVECELAGCCGQNFSVGINGEIFPCECLTPISTFKLGNIQEKSFLELIKSEAYQDMIKKFNNIPEECYKCEVLDLCRGGCLNRRLAIHNLNNGKDLYCESRKAIINRMIDVVKELNL